MSEKFDFNTALEAWLFCANLVVAETDHENLPYKRILAPHGNGRKYLRIAIYEENKETGNRNCSSVFAFVEKETGNVYKPAGFKSPTKNHVRGNIFDLKEAMRWVGPYGIGYMDNSGAPEKYKGGADFFSKVNLSAGAAAKIRRDFGLTG